MSALSTAILADSPYAYWTLGDASGTVAADSSGNSHPGTYNGSPTLAQTSIVPQDTGTSVRFDGSSGKNFTVSTGFSSTATFSAELWIMWNSLRSGSPNGILQLGAESNLMIRASDSGLPAGRLNGVIGSASFSDSADLNNVTTGTLYQIVLTYDGKTARLFLNRVLVASVTVSSTVASGTLKLPWDFTDGRESNCWLQHAALFTSTLNAAQIARHYNAGVFATSAVADLTLTGSAATQVTSVAGSMTLGGSGTGSKPATSSGAVTLGGIVSTLATSSGAVTLSGSGTAQAAQAASAAPTIALTGSATSTARQTVAGSLTLNGFAFRFLVTSARSRTASATLLSTTLIGTAARARTGATVTGIASQSGAGFQSNSGHTRDGTSVLNILVPGHTPPAQSSALPTLYVTHTAPVITNGQPYADVSNNPWLPTTEVHGLWGNFDIVIAGVNVSFFRSDAAGRAIPTVVDKYTDKDPGGDDQCDLLFPSVTSFDTLGTGTLSWLYTDAQVTLRKRATNGTLTTIFEGVVGPIEDIVTSPQSGMIGSQTLVHCIGLWTRLDDFITLPRTTRDPVDSATFIASHVNRAQHYGWPGQVMSTTPVGIPTAEIGAYGEPIASRTITDVLKLMQTATQVYTMQQQRPAKFIITPRRWNVSADFTLWCGQRGVSHTLSLDPSVAFNAIYGHGQAPYGPVDPVTGLAAPIADWENWKYPNAYINPPAYPLGAGVFYNCGDGHTGLQPFSDELRAHGYPLTSQDTYLCADQGLIQHFQQQSGIQVDGIIGPQTWNAAFQTGINASVLSLAYVREIVSLGATQPDLVNARGAPIGRNTGFDPVHVPRREKLEQFGAVTKANAIASAKLELGQISTPYYTGTITATNIDPPEMAALDTRSGMTLGFQGHKGAALRKLYVAHTDRKPGMMPGRSSDRVVTWMVSERPDDLMTLVQRMTRDKGIKDVVSSNRPPRRGAKRLPDFPIFDAESGAGLLQPGPAQTAGLWNTYLIPMGQVVDVNGVRIVADAAVQIAAAIFADPTITVQQLIALPGMANPSVGATDPWTANQQTLLSWGIQWATGGPNAMQGYWPNQPGGATTGVLADTASWPYRSDKSVFGKLFVWTSAGCHINGDPDYGYRVIYPNPI